MDSNQIRTLFTSFFEEKGHVVRPSASLIPVDPTLLLTNAGMVPFKPYFLGEEPAPFDRATTVQKVVRTVDIDIIGTTQRHLSFFEMLGNFSFGDYFKEEAIAWAYELVTERLGLDPERLWYTVHETDDEAEQIWIDQVGVPAARVQRGGKDNFWQMGVPGPCGPCSEIFWDKGDEYGAPGGPIVGGEDRFLEIWNLVFMQNIQDEPYHVIGDLPAKSIDTGMGLDRVAVVMQGVSSVFDIDTTRHIRDVASAYTGLTYGENEFHDVSLRILADHARAVTFLIGDGVIPSNDGRGYVLRRLLRRAVRHAWQYGGERLVFPDLVQATVDVMGDWYTELQAKKDFITQVVTREEERFRRTLESGHQLLDLELGDHEATLSGSTAFKLHDTYGFPIELTREIAAERGVTVDSLGFEEEMTAQRKRARDAWKGGDDVAALEIYRSVLEVAGLTDFVGYEQESAHGQVLAIVADGETIDRAEEGRAVEVFLSRSPFYAESGGQVGDTGVIETETGTGSVRDTQHALQGLHGHRLEVESGFIAVGQQATAVIDSPRREAIRKSHTGTHVLHWALRDVLGEHARQAGSLVEPGRVRFDFSHFAQVAPQELADVEAEVNQRLIDNARVETTVTTKEQAEKMGALAFFGDKYGETVRVVRVGEYSIELCGGTHTHSSAQVGPLLVTSESSIGSNLRRLEALTGMAAYQRIAEVRESMDHAGQLLKVGAPEVPARVEALLARVSGLEKELDTIRAQKRGELAEELASSPSKIGDASLVVAGAGDLDANALRQLALGIRDRLGGRSVVVVGSEHAGKGVLIGLVSKDLMQAGVSAAGLIADAARELGGGGSNDPELAQAGGQHGGRLPQALDLAREAAERALGGL